MGIRIHAEKVQLLAPIPGTDFMLAWDLLGSPTFTTAADTFYYVYVELVGQTLTVYRGATPESMERVLEASEQIPAPIPSGLEATYGQFAADVSGLDGWYCLDDVAVIEDPAAHAADVEYYYDALGRRIEKRVNGEVTRYLHYGPRIIEELVGGVSKATYVYGDYIDDRILMTREGVSYYYHTDDMYNTVALTGSAGQVVERYDYGDYGTPEFFDASETPIVTNASVVGNPYLFNGRRWDEETGLYHYRSRYMDPATGRFTTRDTIGIWADVANRGNPYAYANNNPWSSLDPFGTDADNAADKDEEAKKKRLEEFREAMENGDFRRAGEMAGQEDVEMESPTGDFFQALANDHEAQLELAAMVNPAGDVALAGMAMEQGDYWGAGFAMAGVVPVAGDALKYAGKGIRRAADAGFDHLGGAARLPQDIAVAPMPPGPLNLDRPISRSPTQNAAAYRQAQQWKDQGYRDIRINQQQVNAAGQRVGTNRPDLQGTNRNTGRREYVEFDTRRSNRGPGHRARTLANDPSGISDLRTVD